MWPRMVFSTPRRAMVSLFIGALLCRLLVIAVTDFDGLYGQDAFAYYDYARTLWDSTHRLQWPAPFYWPLGYPALVDIAFIFGGFVPQAGQAVSVLGGALMAPLVFALTRALIADAPPLAVRRASLSGPLVAGLCVIVAGQWLQMSLSIMADVAATWWAAVSAWCILRYARQPQARWLVLSAFTLTYAAFTRWIFGALLLPWALSCLLVWRDVSPHWSGRVRRAGLHLLLAAPIPLLLLFIQYGALIPSNSTQHAWLVGWRPFNAFARVFDNVDGHFEYALPVGLFYAQPVAHPYYLFPLLTPFILLGFWTMRQTTWVSRLVIMGWLIVTYGFLIGIPYENFRFGLALWPPLVVMLGVGFTWLWTHPFTVQRKAWRMALLVLVSISLLGMSLWSVRGLRTFLIAREADLQVVRWTERIVPSSATVITFELTEYFKHYTSLSISELYYQTPETLRILTCEYRNVFLVVDSDSLQTRWANREPDLNVRWLREQAKLRELDHYGDYTLYQVGRTCDVTFAR